MINNRLQRGFYLLEAIVMVSVIISLMSLGSRYITQNAERTVNQITATQLQQVTQAAQQYVQDRYQTFKEDPNKTLQPEDLVNQGYLSDTVSKKNSYGQTYTIKVHKDDKGLLQVVLTTKGGRVINEQSLRQVAALAGSNAGYASVLDKNKITGNQQSWFLEGVPLKPGHLASLTIINEKEVMDAATFLRRRSFPGHPEYNRMETDLEIEKHLLKIVDNSFKTELSSKTINIVDNPFKTELSSKTINMAYQYNKDRFKHIILDVDGTPSLKMKDTYNSFGDSESRLSSTQLEFSRGIDGNNIYLNNKDPSVTIKNSKTWSSQITPSEIRLESQASGNKSYIGNDYLQYNNKNSNLELSSSKITIKSNLPDIYNLPTFRTEFNENHININPLALTTNHYPDNYLGSKKITNNNGMFSQITDSYIKIPLIEVPGPTSTSWADLSRKLEICQSTASTGPNGREGAMFLMAEQGDLSLN